MTTRSSEHASPHVKPRRLAYSPRQLSEETGIPYETVLEHIYSGELEAIKRGRRWVIPLHAVKAYVGWPKNDDLPA